jgi:hypothetical protein
MEEHRRCGRRQSSAVHLLGSGSLFQIADQRFVVTAAHVVKSAHARNKTIGITGDTGCMISVDGEWMVSASNLPEDPLDIAVYRLPERALAKLRQSRFLRIADADFGEQPKSAVYTVFGHPGIWASPSRRDEEALQLKGLEYSAYTYERSIETLEGYEPKYHLLLDAEAERVSWSDGSKATFRKLDGSDAIFPRALKGISGGPVWRIGDLSVPIDDWPQKTILVPPSFRIFGELYCLPCRGDLRALLIKPPGEDGASSLFLNSQFWGDAEGVGTLEGTLSSVCANFDA